MKRKDGEERRREKRWKANVDIAKVGTIDNV
jgi:hypothetical protein